MMLCSMTVPIEESPANAVDTDASQVMPDSSLHAPRRSQREKRKPDRYGFSCNLTAVEEPVSVNDALTRQEWIDTMNTEMDSLHDNDVWDLVELPTGEKVVGSKWIFKVKQMQMVPLKDVRPALWLKHIREKGLNYDETFSPVVRSESIRSVIALVSKNGLKLHQMDVATAFLNGELKEEVYTEQPKGIVIKGQEHLVCRLKKNLYGLKQSPRCWNQALHAQLTEMGFKQTPSDPCIYTSQSDGLFVLAVYVDDILMAGKSAKKMTQVKGALARRFQVKDLGELHYFLGVSVKQSSESGHTWIC